MAGRGASPRLLERSSPLGCSQAGKGIEVEASSLSQSRRSRRSGLELGALRLNVERDGRVPDALQGKGASSEDPHSNLEIHATIVARLEAGHLHRRQASN